jgi:hypothetical protein
MAPGICSFCDQPVAPGNAIEDLRHNFTNCPGFEEFIVRNGHLSAEEFQERKEFYSQ